MGVWQRIADFFLGRKGPAPGEELDAAIGALETRIRALQGKAADLARRQQALDAEMDSERREIETWTAVSQAAAASGRDPDLREAVEMRLLAQRKLDQSQAAQQAVSGVLRDLQERLARAQQQLDFAKDSRLALEARLDAARLRQQMAGDLGGGPSDALKELEQAALAGEGRAAAYEKMNELTRPAAGAPIAAEELEAEIAKLKGRRPSPARPGDHAT
jgi:phage shock protein A